MIGETTTLQELARRALAFEAARPAIEHEGRWFTWGEIRRTADEVAAALAGTGAEPGRPVALVPRNRASAVAALVALLAEGRNVQMVYAFQAPAALARNLGRLKPAVVIGAARELSEEVRAFLQAEGIAAIEIEDMGAHAVPGLERTRRAPDPDAPHEPQIELFTSGTTGPPKQRPFPYAFFARTHVLPPMLARPDADWANEPPPFLPYPIGNISGMMSTLPPILRGQPILLPDRYTLEGWRDWVVRFRPAIAGLPPAGVRMILDADLPDEDLASVKFLPTGGAPLDAADQRRFLERYGIPVLLAYGATEFGGTVAMNTPETWREFGGRKAGSAGRPVPGAKIRVVDPETFEPLGPDREGILEVVAPAVGPDWIRTSDLALIDEDGFLFHRGRADGAIVRGGFKLVPEMIERALLAHPAVGLAAVVGRRDRRLGEVPVAILQLEPGASPPGRAELEAHARANLPATHIPVDWKIVEALPRTPSMKVDRQAIRRMFEPA